MDELLTASARLLERAQAGAAVEVLAESEELLAASTGNLVDGRAALHFPRVVALMVLGEPQRAIAAANLMLVAADREDALGWRSNALSLRAETKNSLVEADDGEYEIDDVLRDLAEAEAALAHGSCGPFVAANAHTDIAIGYDRLRLYELALPHYQAAYDVSAADPSPDSDGPSMWLCNLAELHLRWAIELDRVHLTVEAKQHRTHAFTHAMRAAQEAAGPEGVRWRDSASMLAACAQVEGDDPEAAAHDIERLLCTAQATGITDEVSFARIFQARALHLCGRQNEALEVIGQAIQGLRPDADWLIRAGVDHTHADLLAQGGSAGARAALAYADNLAGVLWRHRERVLLSARTMQAYELLRVDHEQVARSAETDPLTEIANRRGFDGRVLELVTGDARSRVAVLVIDLDRFKQVNDTCGHGVGDQALWAVAQALAAIVREGDLVSRLGGDEFGVLLPGTGTAIAARIANRMVEAVRTLPGAVTISVGVASGPSGKISGLMVEADHAMYAAKRSGGDRVGAADFA